MKKKIAILGSTGSIGKSTLDLIKKDKTNFEVVLLTSHKNVKELDKQAKIFNVKNLIITDYKSFISLKRKYKKKKIRIFNNYKSLDSILNKKIDYTMSSISGLIGLEPTLKIIKNTKTIAIANKESIICGWELINRRLKKYKTNFIPVDSEHFSVWSLIRNSNYELIDKIYITASGGPFLNWPLKKILKATPSNALKHPNWSMGKKISIDSATMMNKIFEVLEAKKIFNLDQKIFEVIIHPKSYVHAIVHFKTGLIKFLAHDTTMQIPILNSLYKKEETFVYYNNNLNIKKINNIFFFKPNIKNFPLLKILNFKFNNTYFEVILVALNDALVKMYLENSIKYISIHELLLKLLKNQYFSKYYKISPKNINEIKNMVIKVNKFLYEYLNKR